MPAYVSGIMGYLWVVLAALGLNLVLWRSSMLNRAFASPLALGTRMLDIMERRYNRDDLSDRDKWVDGVSVLIIGCAVAALAGAGIYFIGRALPFGWWLEALSLSVILTQRSAYDEIRALCNSVGRSEAEGRAALALIGLREVDRLDASGIVRAGGEILSFSFNRGVIGPIFYMLIGGLPAAFLFKMVNVADRMIGAKTRDRHGFGRAFAALNRILLWPVSLLTCLWLTLLSLFVIGPKALAMPYWALQGARRHPIKIDGWIAGAFAGLLNMQLGGPRHYDGVLFDVPMIGKGQMFPECRDLERALHLYVILCAALAVLCALLITVLEAA